MSRDNPNKKAKHQRMPFECDTECQLSPRYAHYEACLETPKFDADLPDVREGSNSA